MRDKQKDNTTPHKELYTGEAAIGTKASESQAEKKKEQRGKTGTEKRKTCTPVVSAMKS